MQMARRCGLCDARETPSNKLKDCSFRSPESGDLVLEALACEECRGALGHDKRALLADDAAEAFLDSEEPCWHCSESGECPDCSGEGDPECPTCEGSAVCTECDGEGFVEVYR